MYIYEYMYGDEQMSGSKAAFVKPSSNRQCYNWAQCLEFY